MVYFPGCPGAKKTEFLTSVLDALSTDMVHAVTDPASAGRYDNIQWVYRPPPTPPPILPPNNVRFSAMEKPATTATY